MLAKLLVELIGTAVFLSVILSQGQAIPIAIALAAMIYFGGAVSGGNFNPAVSFMEYLGGKMDYQTTVMYVVAQLVGAYVALRFNQIAM